MILIKELIRYIRKELKGLNFGMKSLLIFIAIVMFIGTLLIDYFAFALIVYALCWCFSLEFSFKFVLGLYLIYYFIRNVISNK